jgi:hypothetical protein
LASFVEIIPHIPAYILERYVNEMIPILTEKLKTAMLTYDIDNENDYKKMQVCNNGCWTIGELAIKVPEKMRTIMPELL